MTLRRVASQSYLHNDGPHVLVVEIAPDRPMRVRRNRILAQVGQVEYYHEQDDNQAQTRHTLRRIRAKKARARELAGDLANAASTELDGILLGAGQFKAHRATGTGVVHMGWKSGDVTVFELAKERLSILRPAEFLTYDNALTLTLEKSQKGEMAAVLETGWVWALTGSGQFATATPGEPAIIAVAPDSAVTVEVEAVLAFTGDVAFSAAEGFRSHMAKRDLKWILKRDPQVGLDLGRERVWLNAEGSGEIIIRGSD